MAPDNPIEQGPGDRVPVGANQDYGLVEEKQALSSYLVAFSAGLVAALITSVVAALVRTIIIRLSAEAFPIAPFSTLTSLNISPELLLGSFFTRTLGPSAWLLGFGIFLVGGGLIGLIYGTLFRMLRRSGPVIGVAIGFVHWFISGMLMSIFEAYHPLVPKDIAPVGLWGYHSGTFTFVTILALDLLYGGIVGSIFGTSKRAEALPMQEAEEGSPQRKASRAA